MENTNANNRRPLFKDPRVVAVVDEVMQKVRDILDQFEGIVHEFIQIARMLSELFEQVKRLFSRSQFNAAPQQQAPGTQWA